MPGMLLNPWNLLLIAVAGWRNRQQAGVIEYLREENRVLRELHGKKRLRLNDDQRRRLVRPKQPYIDWANSMDDDGPQWNPDIAEASIYLVERIELLEDLPVLIDTHWEWIFADQLSGWMRDPETWPDRLTREMFIEWFECKVSTVIWDLLNARIKHQD